MIVVIKLVLNWNTSRKLILSLKTALNTLCHTRRENIELTTYVVIGPDCIGRCTFSVCLAVNFNFIQFQKQICIFCRFLNFASIPNQNLRGATFSDCPAAGDKIVVTRIANRNYSAILATLQITSYALGV
jgi:hypothetical protein